MFPEEFAFYGILFESKELEKMKMPPRFGGGIAFERLFQKRFDFREENLLILRGQDSIDNVVSVRFVGNILQLFLLARIILLRLRRVGFFEVIQICFYGILYGFKVVGIAYVKYADFGIVICRNGIHNAQCRKNLYVLELNSQSLKVNEKTEVLLSTGSN